METIAKKGCKVKIHFTCKLEDGSIFDSSLGKAPLEFTIGQAEVIQGLEEAVTGMSLNETKTVKITPDKGFEAYDQSLVQIMPRSLFPQNVEPVAGLKFEMKPKEGVTKTYTIILVSDSEITLDGNPPLAGKDLYFDINLLEVTETNLSKAEELFTQGISFQDHGRLNEAISAYQQSFKLNPYNPVVSYNMGTALQKLDRLDEAILCYKIAISVNLDYAEAYHNMGIAYKEKGQLDEAEEHLRQAIHIDPQYESAINNLSKVLFFAGKFSDIIPLYENLLLINPGNIAAKVNRSIINLILGNYEEGWKGYESRRDLPDKPQRIFTKPLWDGSDLQGRTILLHTEEGFGDTLQFVRYAPLVAQKGGRVLLECQPELQRTLRNVQGVHQVFTSGEILPDFDLYCPLLSLPLKFKTSLDTIPATIPYLLPNPELIQKWSGKFSSDVAKIGLVWSGDPRTPDDKYRSCALDIFSPLAELKNIVFVSLQKGKASEEVRRAPEGMTILDYTAEISDFSDTAAIIGCLDLIISVDTAVAHLAGALGKPVWTLVPFAPDWRWMLNREDSPWYPTMRLFRQPALGNWQSVMIKVAEELKKLLTNYKA